MGLGTARDHLIHAGEKTERARKVAEYFQHKYQQYSQDNFCSTLGPIHVTYEATWAVEVEVRCKTINQAEALIDLATVDAAVHGWIRIGVDPEIGEELVLEPAVSWSSLEAAGAAVLLTAASACSGSF